MDPTYEPTKLREVELIRTKLDAAPKTMYGHIHHGSEEKARINTL
jgi:hypothetical protein